MTTISSLRSGIATNLATISGLRTSATVPDQPNPPIAIVMPPTITYDTSFSRGLDEYSFPVLVIVGRVSERTAQNNLDAYCNPSGTSSVKAAIESDKTLSGTASTCRVTDVKSAQQLVIGDITYLAVEFTVQVFV